MLKLGQNIYFLLYLDVFCFLLCNFTTLASAFVLPELFDPYRMRWSETAALQSTDSRQYFV
jgi:hypothetical protein